MATCVGGNLNVKKQTLVEHAGPKPLDVKPVGRRSRWMSALTRWKSNTPDPNPRTCWTQTRWMSNPLDEDVVQAGPNPVGRQTPSKERFSPLGPQTPWDDRITPVGSLNTLGTKTRWTFKRISKSPVNPLGVEQAARTPIVLRKPFTDQI
ncbi:predicted protein [Histoplasma mississippiense (nom. inval.)]|uniref:predicted protein n=1 Tax=Ajellomyces capsulatus (strain NAm1 / WU24) TaxID=2059318 RepID=UPI000157D66E|nr:predicted protein [Histoplasma mississippiense (nom. inval.)]EDN05438.1 predicted protein [Histoplasma mississippiense (nom. inval.)]